MTRPICPYAGTYPCRCYPYSEEPPVNTNPFNCPGNVYMAMQSPVPPVLLVSIKKLGPDRVQWNPERVTDTAMTSWLLDGKPATMAQIMAAAEPEDKGPQVTHYTA